MCVCAFSGFILMIKLFSAGGSKIGVGIIVMIVTFSFAVIALADFLLLIKVRLNRRRFFTKFGLYSKMMIVALPESYRST
jgi:hypothetical protein